MLRLISYLSPSIPAGFFRAVAAAIAGGAGIPVELRFEDAISGPLAGDENPFADRTAEVGFVCSPTFRWLRDDLDLLPVPVPVDERAAGRPVYFGEVVVRADSDFAEFGDLKLARWAFNDRNSRSGWFSMRDRVAPASPAEFFSELVHAGSHLESLRLIEEGTADAAAIDSNALLLERRRRPELDSAIRILETWGPFPIQPVVMRTDVSPEIRDSVRETLLRAHESIGPELESYGFARFAEVERSFYL